MASLGTALLGNITSHTDAEKKFRYNLSINLSRQNKQNSLQRDLKGLNRKYCTHVEELHYRPWWQELEDYLLYGLVMLGIITYPTSVVGGNPLNCNFCPSRRNCSDRDPPENVSEGGCNDPSDGR